MKIAFLGNFRVDYTSETHYLKTFQKLGHQVIAYQESEHVFSVNDLKEILTCDMFFWVHTHEWSNLNLEKVLQNIKGKVPIVGYHLDLWLGIEREEDLNRDEYWKWLDHFFTVDKLMETYLNERDNMPKGYFLPAGVFEDDCFIGEKRQEFEHDIIFVGSKAYHKEWPYREELINFLQETYKSRFKLYGREKGKSYTQIRGKDLNDLYASAKIVVGDTLCKNFDYPHYLSDRIFETTGRGGFIIHPYIKGMEELFSLDGKVPEVETYPFKDFQNLKMKIDYYLENGNKRRNIQEAGYNRTKRSHTYTNRLKYILETIENEKTSK